MRRQRWRSGLRCWAGAAAALLGSAAAADSAMPPQWQLGVVAQPQQWREHDAQGRQLLREQGALAGVSLAAALPLSSAQLDLRLHWLHGRRDYDGQTQRGRPLQTHSDASELGLRLGARWLLPAPSERADGWFARGGLALEQRQRHRRIADAGEVRGYAERYRLPLLLAGAWLHAPTGWQLGLELGAGPGGQMRLRLPGRDQATLPLGRATLVRAALAGELGPQGRWHWQLQHERLQLRAGDPRPVTLQGVVVGAARQPRTETQDWQLTLGYRL